MTIRYKCDNNCEEDFVTSDDEGRCPCCGQKSEMTLLQPFTLFTVAGPMEHINVSEVTAKQAASKGMKLFRGHLEEVKS